MDNIAVRDMRDKIANAPRYLMCKAPDIPHCAAAAKQAVGGDWHVVARTAQNLPKSSPHSSQHRRTFEFDQAYQKR